MPSSTDKMFFLEPAVWKVGEDVFTVLVDRGNGVKMPVGYIKLDRFDENKRPIFSSRDLRDRPLFEVNSPNLYQLKRRFRDNIMGLTKQTEEFHIAQDLVAKKLLDRSNEQAEPEHEAREDIEPALDQPTENKEPPENALHVIYRKKNIYKRRGIER